MSKNPAKHRFDSKNFSCVTKSKHGTCDLRLPNLTMKYTWEITLISFAQGKRDKYNHKFTQFCFFNQIMNKTKNLIPEAKSAKKIEAELFLKTEEAVPLWKLFELFQHLFMRLKNRSSLISLSVSTFNVIPADLPVKAKREDPASAKLQCREQILKFDDWVACQWFRTGNQDFFLTRGTQRVQCLCVPY